MSKGIIRDFKDKVTPDDEIIGTPQQNFCFVDSLKIAILGEDVADGETMVEASTVTFVDGKGVVRVDDKDSKDRLAYNVDEPCAFTE